MQDSVKIFLDDERPTPQGWYRTYTVEETIAKLLTRQVTELSLDNDLGEELEGYKVLDWLEEQIYNDSSFPLPEITVHSANASRVVYMHRAIESIKKIRLTQLDKLI